MTFLVEKGIEYGIRAFAKLLKLNRKAEYLIIANYI